MRYSDPKRKNIYLIGYRCTGKTSVGNLVSQTLGWRFIDTDDEIVKHAEKTIKEIVENDGWETFRQIEREVIAEVSKSDSCIVATGGGVVLDATNVRKMKQSGKLIWLKARPETIERRLVQDRATELFRPSLTQSGIIAEVEETLKARFHNYDSAKDYSIDTDRATIEKVCDHILKNLDAIRIK